ncbi:MAG: head decoration protein [Actinobacteria bacterium]|jgi:hypothetical protein|nr:head decoration protein [Actinomycetota bacterium]OYZ72131.1 MAG: head decoration protein [Burkholderiales bacterium 24-55-52]HQS59909.1 head decoration protein [Gallionellaceae bacterium]
MPAITESQNLGDLLKYEAPHLYSRDRVTVAAGQTLLLGAVVGIEATTTKVVQLDPAATDGSEIAVGVLAADVDAAASDRTDGILISRHAIVADHALIWPVGITPIQKAAAKLQLKALGILVRVAV